MLVLRTSHFILVTFVVAICLVSASEDDCQEVDMATLRAMAKEQVRLLNYR